MLGSSALAPLPFPPLGSEYAAGKSWHWSQMARIKILVPPRASQVTLGKFRNSLDNTIQLMGLFWHLSD